MIDVDPDEMPEPEGDWRHPTEGEKRRPRQVIDYPDSNMTSWESPAWLYYCEDCGKVKAFATEEERHQHRCPNCGPTMFVAMGRLEYPEDDA